MQPTYMPWIGYLDLMDRADVFVLLDDVSYSHQSWQQRNQIKTSTGLAWLTVPVSHTGHTGQPIRDVVIANPRFWRKHLNSIAANYARAPHFALHMETLTDLFENREPPRLLAALNIAIIKQLAEWAGISSQIVLASELSVEGNRIDRLVSFCQTLNAKTYLSPLGAIDYLADDAGKFEIAGLALRFQNYEHPEYNQCFPPFAAYASAIDLLMNEGPSAAEIIRRGRNEDLSVQDAAQLAHNSAIQSDATATST